MVTHFLTTEIFMVIEESSKIITVCTKRKAKSVLKMMEGQYSAKLWVVEAHTSALPTNSSEETYKIHFSYHCNNATFRASSIF